MQVHHQDSKKQSRIIIEYKNFTTNFFFIRTADFCSNLNKALHNT